MSDRITAEQRAAALQDKIDQIDQEWRCDESKDEIRAVIKDEIKAAEDAMIELFSGLLAEQIEMCRAGTEMKIGRKHDWQIRAESLIWAKVRLSMVQL